MINPKLSHCEEARRRSLRPSLRGSPEGATEAITDGLATGSAIFALRLLRALRALAMTGIVASCLLVISGCGYTTKTLLPPHVKTIYIDNVHNKIDITKETGYDEAYEIYRPGLEREIKKAIKDRFIFDGKLKVVNEKEKASSVLNCDILDFEKQPLRYRDDKTIEEYRLKLVVSLRFTDLVDNAVLIDEGEFVGEKTYSLSGPFVASESSAQTAAITDLARRIVERVVDIW